MVQGLAFLSKKSWHTKNLNNQEKVWIAEERKKAEARKTQELQKQIQQELEQQELDAIAGRKSRRDRGIDWMYEEHGPTSETARQDADKKAEEYLLGKEFVADGAPKGDLDVDNEQEGVNKVVSSASAAAAATLSVEDASGVGEAPEPSVKERNEAFRLRFEDPMFLVAQRAVDIERKMERKKQLLERVTGAVAVDKVDIEKTKKRKEKKKRRDKDERKSGKKRRRSPSSGSSESDSHPSEDRRYRRKSPPRRRDCSPSPGRHEQGRSSRPYAERSREESKQHSRSGDSRHERKRSHSPDNYRRDGRNRDRRSRSRSRSPFSDGERRNRRNVSHDDSERRWRPRSPPSDRHDRRGHGRSPERTRHYHSEERSNANDSRSHRRDISDRYVDDDRKPSASSPSNRGDSVRKDPASDRKYGLQGATKLEHRRPERLGPDEELLRKKREERREQKSRLESAAARRQQRRTPEERARALEEMECNARTYDEHRTTKLRSGHHRDNDDSHSRRDAGGTHASQGSATFLNDIQRRAYGVDHGISMQDRLHQNRNNHQRSHDSRFL